MIAAARFQFRSKQLSQVKNHLHGNSYRSLQRNKNSNRLLQFQMSSSSSSKILKSSQFTKMKGVSSAIKKYSVDPYLLPKSFSIGSIAGFLGSLAGMGGGFIIIPLLTMSNSKSALPILRKIGIKGVSQHVAHGTSLFAVCATGIAGAIGFGVQDLHLDSVAALSLTGMITARMGALFIHKLNQKQLQLGLGIFMICVAPLVPLKPYIANQFGGGTQMVLEDDGENKQNEIEGLPMTKSPIPTPLDQAKENFKSNLETKEYNFNDRILLPSFVGLGSGFISGLFGVGGGAVTVPALTIATDVTHYQALGTSLCAMSLPALAGTITHYQKGNVALGIAVPLACGAFLGGYTGGKLGSKVPEDKLRWGFFALLLSLGSRNLIKIGVFRR